MKIVIIDNYDSFTYNLSHLVKELGADVTVFRNDKFLLIDVIRTYRGRKPMLGVCLGHQAIGEVFGARLTNLSTVYHGVATEGTQYGNDPIFRGMPKRIIMGRYHSWVVDSTSLPECLEVTAMSDDGYIMALRHRHYDIHGIQFHPESVLTPEGRQIVKNWLEL